jgi:MFS transporter, ACS family, tartrate transporter
MEPRAEDSELHTRTMRKVAVRLMPILLGLYIIAYLDRVNVTFAQDRLESDLGFSGAVYGFGAGVFFVAYFFLEVPSNLALHRFGARKWIARIMMSWGILSGLTAFTSGIASALGIGNQHAFYLMRILLGLAEAGFFPGIIFYLTLWFPSVYRGRIVGLFMAAIPISSAIGSPVSGAILGMDGIGGLAGWQWLFLLEGAPSIVLAVITFFYLTDRPADAQWLTAEERTWLGTRMAAERRQREAVHQISVAQSLMHGRIWALALVYFGAVACTYGVGFWLPQIIKAFGYSNEMTGLVTAIPYAVGAVCMVWSGRRSDARAERKWHLSVALLVAAAGIAASTLTSNPALTVLAFTVGSCGVFAALPVFWTLPTAMLSGSAAAAGIAVINSVGNLAGFAGPYAMGWIKDHTGSFDLGLLLIAALAVVAMVIVQVMGHDHSLEKAPDATPAE